MTTSEELRTLANAATPGPWTYQPGHTYATGAKRHYTVRDQIEGGPSQAVLFTAARTATGPDARFIAALSPDVVLRLLDVVDAAEKLRSHEDPDIFAWQNREAALREALDRAVDAWRGPEEQKP